MRKFGFSARSVSVLRKLLITAAALVFTSEFASATTYNVNAGAFSFTTNENGSGVNGFSGIDVPSGVSTPDGNPVKLVYTTVVVAPAVQVTPDLTVIALGFWLFGGPQSSPPWGVGPGPFPNLFGPIGADGFAYTATPVIPVPPSAILFGTAIGGVGLISRRRIIAPSATI